MKVNIKKVLLQKNISQIRKEYLEYKKINSEKNDDYYKYNQKEINDKMKIDSNYWKECINDGNDKKDYNWEIIEDIYYVHKNLINEFLSSYLQIYIDFIQNKNTFQFSNDDLILFIIKILYLIRVAYDYSLK